MLEISLRIKPKVQQKGLIVAIKNTIGKVRRDRNRLSLDIYINYVYDEA